MEEISVQEHGDPDAIDPGVIFEPVRGGRSLIGIASNERHIIAWNYSNGLDVRVTADRIGLHVGEGGKTDWHIVLATQEGAIMEAVATCGRWTCNQLVRFLRNAMTSRKNRVRKAKANRRARREAQAGTNGTDGTDVTPGTACPVSDVSFVSSVPSVTAKEGGEI